jgi:hypothetical protein
MHVPHGRPPSWKASPHPSLVLFSCLFFNPAAEEKVIKKSPCVILRSAMTSATLNDMWVAWGDLILCHARWGTIHALALLISPLTCGPYRQTHNRPHYSPLSLPCGSRLSFVFLLRSKTRAESRGGQTLELSAKQKQILATTSAWNSAFPGRQSHWAPASLNPSPSRRTRRAESLSSL